MQDRYETDFEQARRQIAQWADQEDMANHNPMIRRFVQKVGRPLLCMLGGSLVVAAVLGLVMRLM